MPILTPSMKLRAGDWIRIDNSIDSTACEAQVLHDVTIGGSSIIECRTSRSATPFRINSNFVDVYLLYPNLLGLPVPSELLVDGQTDR